MTEELTLEDVFVVVDGTAEMFDFEQQFPETSFNELRGAWFAYDDHAEMIDTLSDVVYYSHDAAEERAQELGDNYVPFELNAALIDVLVGVKYSGDSEDNSESEESDSEDNSESEDKPDSEKSLSEIFD